MRPGQDAVLRRRETPRLGRRRPGFRRRSAVCAAAVWVAVTAGMPGLAHRPVCARTVSAGQDDRGGAGRTINVPAGGDVQAALNGARPGDTVVLQAGAIYNGTVNLPGKSGDSFITVTTSALTSLPQEGNRISPSDSRYLPRLVATTGQAAIVAAAGAHNYRFVGIEITPEPTATMTYDIVRLGLGNEHEASALPHDIVLDRVYIHAGPMQTARRGVSLNGASLTVENSYISDIKGLGQDTQAIEGWNGPGPFKIVNNYLEAAGENIMFGGVPASIHGLVPSDIEIRHNYLCKPLKWRKEDSSYAGAAWVVKNLFELKNAQRVTVDGNVMENDWTMGQNGTGVLFTPRAEDGHMPWAVVQDVTFTHNIVRHVAAGFNFMGVDDTDKTTHRVVRLHRIVIRDNLLTDVSRKNWVGRGSLLGLFGGPDAVTVDHNTGFEDGMIAMADGMPGTGFVFTNNLVLHGEYGFIGTGTGEGNQTLNHYFPGANFRNNIIVGGGGGGYPQGNFFPRSPSHVGFADYDQGNFALDASSHYRNAGTDGKDPGADMSALSRAVAGVVEGRPQAASRNTP
jgi:hypothetical protein